MPESSDRTREIEIAPESRRDFLMAAGVPVAALVGAALVGKAFGGNPVGLTLLEIPFVVSWAAYFDR